MRRETMTLPSQPAIAESNLMTLRPRRWLQGDWFLEAVKLCYERANVVVRERANTPLKRDKARF
jgi:hypothetical protein